MTAIATEPTHRDLIAAGRRRRREQIAAAGCLHHEGPGHDCAYVDARNALIPAADLAARQACNQAAVSMGSPHYGRVFFAAMQAAAIDAGLTAPPSAWLIEAKRIDEERRKNAPRGPRRELRPGMFGYRSDPRPAS